jgi:AmmeMemoRadiSam system protein A
MSRQDPGPASFARSCIEAFLARRSPPPAPRRPLYESPAACFVSLKRFGELRGCIGTLTPAEADLGREIARNGYGAAFGDPRFPPLAADELTGLTCSVDVLGEPQDCALDDLDPARYGVIVAAGRRRGVLLPDLPGVDSVDRQVAIALQKAGIDPQEPFEVQRFTVRRFAENDALGSECGSDRCAPPGCVVADGGPGSDEGARSRRAGTDEADEPA